MNDPAQLVGALTFFAGVATVVVSVLASLRLRGAQDRLHLLAPTTTLGAPLVGLGLALHSGWGPAAVQICLTCLLLAVTGPVMSTAAARVAAEREGSIPQEEPE